MADLSGLSLTVEARVPNQSLGFEDEFRIRRIDSCHLSRDSPAFTDKSSTGVDTQLPKA
jgi:hypothetical protein